MILPLRMQRFPGYGSNRPCTKRWPRVPSTDADRNLLDNRSLRDMGCINQDILRRTTFMISISIPATFS